MEISAEWEREPFCYVTTTGRRTGRPHEIEIWFVVVDGTFYLMSGGGDRSDWLRNMKADPNVTLRVAGAEMRATARMGAGEDSHIRRAMAAKYQGWKDGEPLSEWAQTALVVGIEPNS